jgi:hypothetical protein
MGRMSRAYSILAVGEYVFCIDGLRVLLMTHKFGAALLILAAVPLNAQRRWENALQTFDLDAPSKFRVGGW